MPRPPVVPVTRSGDGQTFRQLFPLARRAERFTLEHFEQCRPASPGHCLIDQLAANWLITRSAAKQLDTSFERRNLNLTLVDSHHDRANGTNRRACAAADTIR